MRKLLRVVSIYGANASGKSNIHLGMSIFQAIVLGSFNNVAESEGSIIHRYYSPFAFSDEAKNSEFQIILTDDVAEYKYGFEFNSKYIEGEWLYKKDLRTNRTSTILERAREKVSLGATVRKECDKYKEQIPDEALALSFFSRLTLKTPVFATVFEEIRRMLVVVVDHFENYRVMEKRLPEVIDTDKQNFLKFLMTIDTGIKDISYKKVGDRIVFDTFHESREGKRYPIDLHQESQGTLKSIMLYMMASDVISRRGILVVDELNTRLHPLLLKFIVDLFYNEKSKAQLIYTTHDTILLDKKFFRRDQIWFAQKDDYGCSSLIPLSDFKVRSDASFEKDYLSGVYGGIPMLKEFMIEEGE